VSDYALEMIDIKKAFNGIRVLNEVNLKLKKGEIHALVGENGAGKSTLMNILGGVIKKDEGKIVLDGNIVDIKSPAEAIQHGISFIHQELNLVNDLKVYENMFLGNEIKKSLVFIDKEEMCRKSKEIFDKMQIDINPKAFVRDLEASYKQMVEIARALLQNAKIIIMDEPTTSFADSEIHNLFKLMHSLNQTGVSIIYISHKLKEVFEVCNSFTVFKDGNLTGNGAVKDIHEDGLTRLMVGRDVNTKEFYKKRKLGEEILKISNLNESKYFRNINFTVHAGEIIGFTGLIGDGRTELFESIFGSRRYHSGEIFVKGQKVFINNSEKAFKLGIGLVPKNRKENAIIKDMSVLKNITITSLKSLTKNGIINKKLEKNNCNKRIKETNIKVPNANMLISNLSGGNQQKAVLARWLEADSDIIILDNPTQGVDVGAKGDIYNLIMELAAKGKVIIVLSSEIPEILKICDRVYVMYHGEITKIMNRDEASEENIMFYSTGLRREVK
jgi:ribose transport system ATP-binding protein